jgi:hypothetical protein
MSVSESAALVTGAVDADADADVDADVVAEAVAAAKVVVLAWWCVVTPSISTCILDPLPFLTIKTFSTGASELAAAAAAASSKIGCRIRRLALINQLLI